jgi:predicted nicotinamide N-methyase
MPEEGTRIAVSQTPRGVGQDSLPETPRDALGPTIQETVLIAGHRFLIGRPDAVDRLIDHPVSRPSFATAGEYMPYWANLWPTARLLAQVIVGEAWDINASNPPEALEIGCGLGLAGIAALARGLRVIFSDYDATALRYAVDNARLNGFTDFRVLHMDLRRPPEGLRVPVLLGSDVIHEMRMAVPLAAFIRTVLAPNGRCLLTDFDRLPAAALREALTAERLAFQTEVVRGDDDVQGTLYRIAHPA